MIIAIIFTVLIFIASVVVLGIGAYDSDTTEVIAGVGGVIFTLLLTIFEFWYFTSTASGVRSLKDTKSNLSNGLEREITITAEDGREIYHYSGKCDIETQDKYILFEDENSKRQTIYWGALDTIIIREVE